MAHTGVSSSFFYAIIHQVIDAICEEEILEIKFPSTNDEITSMKRKFREISLDNILGGCVGAIDGWLCEITVPSSDEVGHVKSFFSGHYHKYGVNIQACCDYASRFTSFSCNSPGGMNDALAFLKWKLNIELENLPLGTYVVGDNAYVNDVHVITPYNLTQIISPDHDTYNFLLSQLRIRIEMAFGLLVNKWRVFKRPLSVKIKNVGKIIHCCMRLHNYCISQRLSEDCNYTVESELNDFRAEDSQYQSDLEEVVESGNEVLRNAILDHIKSRNVRRPEYNLRRNNNST